MASGLVYAMTDVRGAEVDVTFTGGALDRIEAVRRRQEHAEREVAAASDEMRQIVGALHRQGIKQSEIAALLRVSRQRASQLVKAATSRQVDRAHERRAGATAGAPLPKLRR